MTRVNPLLPILKAYLSVRFIRELLCPISAAAAMSPACIRKACVIRAGTTVNNSKVLRARQL